MKVITNHHWRPFKYRDEVPAHVLEHEFDYQNPEDTIDGFFKYRGIWYHLDLFTHSTAMPGWHGYHSDSYFSGIVIRVSDDGETYQVGLALA